MKAYKTKTNGGPNYRAFGINFERWQDYYKNIPNERYTVELRVGRWEFGIDF